jgi:hypothetical protein
MYKGPRQEIIIEVNYFTSRNQNKNCAKVGKKTAWLWTVALTFDMNLFLRNKEASIALGNGGNNIEDPEDNPRHFHICGNLICARHKGI